jgi:formate/nitrite transporter FocA (FNT family)
MDYVSPSEVAKTFVSSGAAKSRLPAGQLLLRGVLSGALLGFATTVAFTATAQALPPIVGAVLFPVGFAMIVVLGLELVTGSFAMVPAAWLAERPAGFASWKIWCSPGILWGDASMRGCMPQCRRNFTMFP